MLSQNYGFTISFGNYYHILMVLFTFIKNLFYISIAKFRFMKQLYFLIATLFLGTGIMAQSQIDLPITWDDTANVNYSVTDFGGNSSSQGVDPGNSSNLVLSVEKTNTAQTWAGTTLSTTSGLATAIPFSMGNTVMKALVYSPDSGIVVKLKAEDKTNASLSVETDVTTTVANAWDTLTFDFTNNSAGTPAINFSTTYDLLSIFFNFGVDGATAGSKTYLLDNVWFVGGGTGGPTLSQIDLPITWDDTANVDYTVIDFGGNAHMQGTDPNNSSNIVLTVEKTVSAQTWAGTTLSTNAGLATAVPFAMGSTMMRARVYSPDSGIVVKLKAEDAGDPTKSVETDVNTTVANGWDTLTFDFSNHSAGTAPINFTYTYDKVSIFFNFGVDGATAGSKTYHLDDVWFYSAPPATKSVTFQVDMNKYTGSFTTPEVNGDFNGWCGNCNPLTDANSDGIWETTLQLTQDSIEWKFAHDNWTGQESLMQGSACTKTTSGFTNRFAVLHGDTTFPVVCWESCGVCDTTTPPTPDTSMITFRVDMNDYTGSFTTPEVNGTFNGWCGNCNAMTDGDGDGIWETTVTLVDEDTIEWKFSYDNWTGQESLTDGDTCTMTTINGTDTFINRYMVVTGDTVLAAVCWESCMECDTTTSIEGLLTEGGFSIAPNPSTGVINVSYNYTDHGPTMINVINIAGQTIMSQDIKENSNVVQVDLSEFDRGLYFVELKGLGSSSIKKVVLSD